MKILYRQNESNRFGIANCYLKYIFVEKDSQSITKKVHHHTAFEVHIVEQGYQIYEMDGRKYRIDPGDYLIIPPLVKHRVVCSAHNTVRFSITFNCIDKELPEFTEPAYTLCGKLSPPVPDNLNFIREEYKRNQGTSRLLIENRLLETIVLLFRVAGMKEKPGECTDTAIDARVSIAKQYVADNVELNLTITDLAKYSHLSTKHLARLFHKFENISPSDYIKKQRVEHVAALLLDETLSLKDISERMNFNNEYYFNSFVKKNLGVPPGVYRKMHKA